VVRQVCEERAAAGGRGGEVISVPAAVAVLVDQFPELRLKFLFGHDVRFDSGDDLLVLGILGRQVRDAQDRDRIALRGMVVSPSFSSRSWQSNSLTSGHVAFFRLVIAASNVGATAVRARSHPGSVDRWYGMFFHFISVASMDV